MQCNAGAEGLLPDLVEREVTDHEGAGLPGLDDATCPFESDSQSLRRGGPDEGCGLPHFGQRPLGHQSALVDDVDIVGELFHFAEQMAGHEHRVAVRRPGPQQIP